MGTTKRPATAVGGIILVGLFFTWLIVREGAFSVLPAGETGRLFLHGAAWLCLIGGVTLLAAALAAKTRP